VTGRCSIGGPQWGSQCTTRTLGAVGGVSGNDEDVDRHLRDRHHLSDLDETLVVDKAQ
jgi:hypothetical protein